MSEMIKDLSTNCVDNATNETLNNDCQNLTCFISYGILLPAICGIGVTVGVLTVLTLFRMRRSGLNLCLKSLFCCEILKLCCATLIFTPLAHCLGVSPVCSFLRRLVVYAYPTATSCHVFSTLTCVIISKDRFVATSSPFATLSFGGNRAHKLLGAVFAVSVMYSIPASLELEYSTSCRCIVPTRIRDSRIFFVTYHVICRCVMAFLVPFLVILIVNYLLVLHLMRYRRKMNSLECAPRFHRLYRQFDATTGSVAVVLAFFCTNVLTGVNDIFEAIRRETYPDDPEPQFSKYLVYLGNVLVATGPLFHTPIYCACGKAFRRQFMMSVKHPLTYPEQSTTVASKLLIHGQLGMTMLANSSAALACADASKIPASLRKWSLVPIPESENLLTPREVSGASSISNDQGRAISRSCAALDIELKTNGFLDPKDIAVP